MLATPEITIAPTLLATPTTAPTDTPTAAATPEPTATPTSYASPAPGEVFAPIYQDPAGCTMEKAASVVPPAGVSVVVVGWCADDEGSTAMAWQSDDGIAWHRILDREENAYAYGVSADGLGSPVIVGSRLDSEPLVWEPRRGGGFPRR